MRYVLVASLALAAGACSVLTDLTGLGPVSGADAGAADALPDVAADGFALTLSPSSAALNAGDAPVTITINVVRGATFKGVVTLTVTGQPVGITHTDPSPVLGSQTTSSFGLGISGALKGQYELVVTGTSGALLEQAKLPLYVDTTLTPDDAGVVVIPSWASAIDTKAWGAGGGAGGACLGTSGASGGGGGFAAATFAAAPGSTWKLVAGTGGGSSTNDYCGGGGGGGFSGVANPNGTWVLVAGGGGGGGASDSSGVAGGTGGGGGGAKGQDAPAASCVASGGTQTAGGAGCSAGLASTGDNGAAFDGGGGGPPALSQGGLGGKPGGGAPSGPGSTAKFGGGGGGGGGRFGGGGGVFNINTSSGTGGGGGSGFVDPTGKNAVNDPATGASCAHPADPDLKKACIGGDQGGSPGNAGTVVARARP